MNMFRYLLWPGVAAPCSPLAHKLVQAALEPTDEFRKPAAKEYRATNGSDGPGPWSAFATNHSRDAAHTWPENAAAGPKAPTANYLLIAKIVGVATNNDPIIMVESNIKPRMAGRTNFSPFVPTRVKSVHRIVFAIEEGVLIEVRIPSDEAPDLRVVISRADMRQPGVVVVSVAGGCGIHVGAGTAPRTADLVAETIEVERADDRLTAVGDRALGALAVEQRHLAVSSDQALAVGLAALQTIFKNALRY